MIGQILVYVFLFVLGVVPCVFLTAAIPVVITWKIVRSVRYGIKITD